MNYKKIIPLLIYILLSLHTMWDYPIMDETDAVEIAYNINNGNITPMHYKGENFEIMPFFYHSPTYYYYLSFFTYSKLDYVGPRIGQIIIGLGILVLLMQINKRVIKDNKISFIIMLLASISPIFIQNSMIFDYDGGILLFANLLFILAFLKYKEENRFSIPLFLSILFVAIIKEQGIILTSGFLVLYYLVKKDMKGILRATIGYSVLPTAVFFVLWKIYTLSVGFTGSMLIEINDGRGFSRILEYSLRWIQFPEGIISNAWAILTTISWFSPALFFILIPSIIRLIKKIINNKEINNIDTIVLLNIVFLGFDFFLSYTSFGFPKMMAVPSVLMLIILGHEISRLRNINIKKMIFMTAFWLLFYIITPNPIYNITTVFRTGKQAYDPSFIINSIYPIFLALIVCFLIWTYSFTRKKDYSIFAFTGVLAFSLVLSTVHIFVDYNTGPLYGQVGTKDTINFMKNNIGDNEIILCRKDLPVLTDIKFYENWGVLSEEVYSKEQLDSTSWLIESPLMGNYSNIIKDYSKVAEFGVFKIWKRNTLNKDKDLKTINP